MTASTTTPTITPSRGIGAFSRPAAVIAGGVGLVALTALATTLALRTPTSNTASSSTGSALAAATAAQLAAKKTALPATAQAPLVADDGAEPPMPTPKPAEAKPPKPAPATAPARKQSGTVAQSTAPAAKTATAAAAVCTRCGVVESVVAVKQKGDATGVGAIGGAVLGGVLGHQMGGGRGKDAMTAVGVVGGGIAGHEVEKRARATTVYQVKVRMDDGSTRTVQDVSAPAVGAKVTLDGSTLKLRAS